MATTLQKGLFGGDPVEMQMQQQKLWQNAYANAQNPYEKIGIALGQIGATALGGETPFEAKAKAINNAITQAGQQYQAGTAEYYKAIADALPEEYSDSKEFATQKYLETKKAEAAEFAAERKGVREDPGSIDVYAPKYATSLLAKAESKGFDPTKDPIPQTTEEIKAFAKLYELDKEPAYNKFMTLRILSEKEARKETQQEEQRLLTMESIRSTIAKNNRDMQKIKDDKFEAGNRWNQERESAIALFRANNLDPNVPLRGINLANTELVNAQRIALRQPWTGKATEQITPPGATAPSATKGSPSMTPVALPADKRALQIGQVYSTPNGDAQWDGSKFNKVAK